MNWLESQKMNWSNVDNLFSQYGEENPKTKKTFLSVGKVFRALLFGLAGSVCWTASSVAFNKGFAIIGVSFSLAAIVCYLETYHYSRAIFKLWR